MQYSNSYLEDVEVSADDVLLSSSIVSVDAGNCWEISSEGDDSGDS